MANKIDYANSINDADLDTIYITGAGYINYPFRGISNDSALGWEEPVWGGELTRSTDFSLSNIDTVDFGLVARVEVSYKYMNVADYLALMKISKERVCIVNYYSRDLGKRVTQEMAFTGNEITKLYSFGTKYLGMTGVSIKLVATNRDKVDLIKSSHTITFDANGGTGSVSPITIVYAGAAKLPSQSSFTKTGYILSTFNTKADGTGDSYLPEQTITVYEDMKLYAIWE